MGHHKANNKDKVYIIHHPTKIKQHQSFKMKPIKRKCITFVEMKYTTLRKSRLKYFEDYYQCNTTNPNSKHITT